MIRRLALCASVAAALAVPGIASAATTVDSAQNPISSGNVSLGGYQINGGVSDLALLDLDVTAKANWSGNLWTGTGWESSNVRQGAKLTVSRASPVQFGTMHVSWTVSGRVNPLDQGYVNIGAITVADDASCMPALIGTSTECTATSPSIALIKTPGIPGSPYVKVLLKANFTITPEGAIVNRTFSVGGVTESTQPGLGLSLTPATETVTMPCDAVGSAVAYRLGSMHYAPAVTLTQQPTIQVGLMDPVVGLAELPALYDHAFGLVIKSHPVFDLSGSGHTSQLGMLMPNNVAPSVSVGSFSGTAGNPIQFSANVSARCGATYTWHFSNGTTSYGANPTRAFAKGAYDGELVVTDGTGLQTKRDFSVTVS